MIQKITSDSVVRIAFSRPRPSNVADVRSGVDRAASESVILDDDLSDSHLPDNPLRCGKLREMLYRRSSRFISACDFRIAADCQTDFACRLASLEFGERFLVLGESRQRANVNNTLCQRGGIATIKKTMLRLEKWHSDTLHEMHALSCLRRSSAGLWNCEPYVQSLHKHHIRFTTVPELFAQSDQRSYRRFNALMVHCMSLSWWSRRCPIDETTSDLFIGFTRLDWLFADFNNVLGC
jgi:hypothetical protein